MRAIDRNSSAKLSMAESVLGKWATRICVDVRRDVFTFHTKARVLQLAACVYVSASGTPREILAVGDSVAVPNAEKLALFPDHDRRPPDIERPDILCHFLRFAIKTMISKGTVIRPVVIFRNIQEMETYFHGYQKAIFSDAALFAGAMKVYFE